MYVIFNFINIFFPSLRAGTTVIYTFGIGIYVCEQNSDFRLLSRKNWGLMCEARICLKAIGVWAFSFADHYFLLTNDSIEVITTK